MSYWSNKAAGRDSNQTDVTDFSGPSGPEADYEQFSATGGKRKVAVGDGSKYDAGTLVRVQANPNATTDLKDPLQSYQRRVLPASENPDGGRDRSGRVVAGKATDKQRI